MEKSSVLTRRGFLGRLAAGGAVCISGLSLGERLALGMGAFSYPQGIQKITGEVKINGVAVQVGTPVQEGDMVATGPDSMAIFVMEKSVYLVRADTQLIFTKKTAGDIKEKISTVLKILKGKILSVHPGKKRRVITPTAVVGLRGTGVYVEAETDRTYFCVCYGRAELGVADTPDVMETVHTRHHEAPRYIYRPGVRKGSPIVQAPVINHTDAELIMLEKMVWRKPPFVTSNEQDGSGGGGGGGSSY